MSEGELMKEMTWWRKSGKLTKKEKAETEIWLKRKKEGKIKYVRKEKMRIKEIEQRVETKMNQYM